MVFFSLSFLILSLGIRKPEKYRRSVIESNAHAFFSEKIGQILQKFTVYKNLDQDLG